jgi:hypothetical protein
MTNKSQLDPGVQVMRGWAFSTKKLPSCVCMLPRAREVGAITGEHQVGEGSRKALAGQRTHIFNQEDALPPSFHGHTCYTRKQEARYWVYHGDLSETGLLHCKMKDGHDESPRRDR